MAIANLDQAPVLDSTKSDTGGTAPTAPAANGTTASKTDDQKIGSPKWRQWYDQLGNRVNDLISAVNTVVASLTSPNDQQKFLQGTNPIGWALPRVYYGEMWEHDHTTPYTQALTLNVPAKLAIFDFSNHAQKLNGFTYLASALTCQIAGLYKATYTYSFSIGNPNDIVMSELYVNSTGMDNFDMHGRLGSTTDVITVSCSGFLQLAVNDVVSLFVVELTSSATLTVLSANVNLIRLSD